MEGVSTCPTIPCLWLSLLFVFLLVFNRFLVSGRVSTYLSCCRTFSLVCVGVVFLRTVVLSGNCEGMQQVAWPLSSRDSLSSAPLLYLVSLFTHLTKY